MSTSKAKKGKKGAAPAVPVSPPLRSDASSEQVLHAALKQSLFAGEFVDTKFYAFSRRAASGRVHTPLPVFANSVVIRKASPHFERLLSGGFSESQIALLHGDHHLLRDDSTFEYDYASDSDLDDDEDEDDADADLVDECDSVKGKGIAVPSGSQDNSVTAKEYPDGSMDEMSDQFGQLANPTVAPSVASTMARPAPDGKTGRVIYIKDVALKTWQAFIFYVYTGRLEFAPLKSQPQGFRSEALDERTALSRPPRCSPKSMYRLAEKYDLKELKDLALKEIESRLTKDNILVEIFSGFTSRYAEVCNAQVDYLTKNVEGPVLAQIPSLIDSIAAGQMPHCCGVLNALAGRVLPGLSAALQSQRRAKCSYCPSACSSCGRD